jgi:hypothetical protein
MDAMSELLPVFWAEPQRSNLVKRRGSLVLTPAGPFLVIDQGGVCDAAHVHVILHTPELMNPAKEAIIIAARQAGFRLDW